MRLSLQAGARGLLVRPLLTNKGAHTTEAMLQHGKALCLHSAHAETMLDYPRADGLKSTAMRQVQCLCHRSASLKGNTALVAKDVAKIPLVQSCTSLCNHLAERLTRCCPCAFVHLTCWFCTQERISSVNLSTGLRNAGSDGLSVPCLASYLPLSTTALNLHRRPSYNQPEVLSMDMELWASCYSLTDQNLSKGYCVGSISLCPAGKMGQ